MTGKLSAWFDSPWLAMQTISGVTSQSLKLPLLPATELPTEVVATESIAPPDPVSSGSIFDTPQTRHHSDRVREQILQSSPGVVPAAKLKRDQALALFKKIGAVLHDVCEDHLLDAMLAELIRSLKQSASEEISLECWAHISLQCEKIEILLAQLPELSQPLSQPHISPLGFIAKNLAHMTLTSYYCWARMAREAVITQCAHEIETKIVANPALYDVKTGKASVQISTPLSCLAVGVEVSHRRMERLDDEGNFISSKDVSVAATAKADVIVASIGGNIKGTAGTYLYCKNAVEHATLFFQKLLKDNREKPSVIRYLSRIATRGVAGKHNELAGFDVLQERYLGQQQKIAENFSLLLSLDYTLQARTVPWVSEAGLLPSRQQIALNQAAPKAIRPTEGIEIGKSVSATGTLGLNVKALQLKTGLTAQALAQIRTKYSRRGSPLCELLQNQFVDASIKAEMKKALADASAPTRKRLYAFWYADVRESDDSVKSLYEQCQKLLDDFACYTQWQARLAESEDDSHTGTLTSIRLFQEKYGVSSNASCLQRMAVLSAYFYSQLMDINPGDAEAQERLDSLKKSLLKQEFDLHTTGVASDRAYLQKHAFGCQDSSYASRETSMQVTVNAGDLHSPVGAQSGFKISTRSLDHSSSLRDGGSVTLEFTLGINATMNRQIIETIETSLRNGVAGSEGLGALFAQASYTASGTYSVRFFKPAGFEGLPWKRQYARLTRQASSDTSIGATIPIPVAGFMNLSVAAGYTQSSNQFISETVDSHSALYFAQHYMHTLANDKTSKAGQKIQDSYWYRMEREQTAALADLFKNYARDAKTSTGLIRELNAIEATWFKKATPAERNLCRLMRQAFLQRVASYLNDPCDEEYQFALAGFKELLRAYFPLWRKNKEASPVYKKWTMQLQ